uniref:Uncharacterized protein n=1 Tax=viral metagenome TaxID=1070528 RepID=A0A6C0AF51_9ZZZZ
MNTSPVQIVGSIVPDPFLDFLDRPYKILSKTLIFYLIFILLKNN